jgi:hypothetical protein
VDQVLGEEGPEVTADGAGAASRGLVVPIIERTTANVSSGPSMTITIAGDRDMKETRPS